MTTTHTTIKSCVSPTSTVHPAQTPQHIIQYSTELLQSEENSPIKSKWMEEDTVTDKTELTFTIFATTTMAIIETV